MTDWQARFCFTAKKVRDIAPLTRANLHRENA
jgi:hypothetical protein